MIYYLGNTKQPDNKILRAVIGNLKHEGIELEPDEMVMLQKLIDGEISEEEFDQWAIEKVK